MKKEFEVYVADVIKCVSGKNVKDIEHLAAEETKRRFIRAGIKFDDREGLYPIGHSHVTKSGTYQGHPIIKIVQYLDE
ncbi:hypothetical protein [Tolumonas lignilytica]|uniref:hypothetical protein n=1 Tax=Tolumonas lignilytica TaxID=1283284 RepID=UPI0004641B9A|nr:hypothetical protein [Tolumonas lignilytica]